MLILTDNSRLRGKTVFLILFFLFAGAVSHARQLSEDPPLEKQYEQLISEALRLQVRADSLIREAARLRRELPGITDRRERSSKERLILELESRGFRIQSETDEKYERARKLEIKLIAARQREREKIIPEHDCPEVSFLTIAGTNSACFLPEEDLADIDKLEEKYKRANRLISEAAETDLQIEKNLEILEGSPRRRVRRRTERENEELEDKYLSRMGEALLAFEITGFLRYKANKNALAHIRATIIDPSAIVKGLAHEEKAAEAFNEAAERRRTSGSLRSREFLEEYLLTAYKLEKQAFSYQEAAWDSYNLSSDMVEREPDDLTDYGFEVLPHSPYSPENPVPFDIALPGGLVYRIQLGIYLAPMGEQLFGGITPLTGEYMPERRAYKYYAGMFRNINEAERVLTKIRSKGFRDAFIVAWYDGNPLPVSRAVSLESSRRDVALTEEAAPEPPTADTAEAVVGEEEQPEEAEKLSDKVIFKVQVGVFSEILSTENHRTFTRAAGSRELQWRKNNQGYYVYSIGNFNTFEEALLMQKQLNAQGLTDAFVVAYKGEERIPVEEARKLLQKSE